jgi:repressor LexA
MKNMKPLTERQQTVLDAIISHQRTYHRVPTRVELATALNLRAVSTVEQHLRVLAAKGYLKLDKGFNCNIRVTEDLLIDESAKLPLLGKIAAGPLNLAEAHAEARYHIDPELFHPKPDYLLRADGDSMINAGISPNDILAVHHTDEEPANGKIVVALIDLAYATVKRFERVSKNQVRLLAENPDYDPIIIDMPRHRLDIQGLVVGVIRRENL